MAKAKAKTQDMYFVIWNSDTDENGHSLKISTESMKDSYPEINGTVFSSEREALAYIQSEIKDGNFNEGFYSVVKLTRQIHIGTQVMLKEVA